MTVELHRPGPELAGYISLMVYHEGITADYDKERLLPDGGIELIIDLTPPPKYIFDHESLAPTQACKGAWLAGFRTRPITISAAKNSRMMVVSFHPFGAYPLLGVPLIGLQDAVVQADDVLGSFIGDLRERLLNEPDAQACFHLAEAAFLAALRRRRRVAESRWGLARFAVDWIQRAPAMGTIDAIARESGASNRHLIDSFKEIVGVTPKQFQRVKRFHRVVQAVDGREQVDWAGVALDCGFYDQAHLIRDFRHFSGMTPGEYLAARGDYSGYVPVA